MLQLLYTQQGIECIFLYLPNLQPDQPNNLTFLLCRFKSLRTFWRQQSILYFGEARKVQYQKTDIFETDIFETDTGIWETGVRTYPGLPKQLYFGYFRWICWGVCFLCVVQIVENAVKKRRWSFQARTSKD